jgi:hypothetical protein
MTPVVHHSIRVLHWRLFSDATKRDALESVSHFRQVLRSDVVQSSIKHKSRCARTVCTFVAVTVVVCPTDIFHIVQDYSERFSASNARLYTTSRPCSMACNTENLQVDNALNALIVTFSKITISLYTPAKKSSAPA